MWEGYLVASLDCPRPRIWLLALLLTNVGVVERVRLAPREAWEDALRQAYPSG